MAITLDRAIKNKTDGAMIKAYLALQERLTAKGTVSPTAHIIDNEVSAEYKNTIHIRENSENLHTIEKWLFI